MVLIYSSQEDRIKKALDRCDQLSHDAPHILVTDDPSAAFALASKHHSGILIRNQDTSKIEETFREIPDSSIYMEGDDTVNFSLDYPPIYKAPEDCTPLKAFQENACRILISSVNYIGEVYGWLNSHAKGDPQFHVDHRDETRIVTTLRGEQTTAIVASLLGQDDYIRSIPQNRENDDFDKLKKLLDFEYIKERYPIIYPELGDFFVMKCYTKACREKLQSPVHASVPKHLSHNRLFLGMGLRV